VAWQPCLRLAGSGYLRAVPADVLQRAGNGGPSLVERGSQLIKENN